MKRFFVIILTAVCGVVYSDGFAQKPKKPEKTEEEMQIELEQFVKQHWPTIDSVRIDSITCVPVFINRDHNLMLPKIYYHNRADYIKFAFGDTDKTKYYCATGRGEADTYGKARHEAMVDAVMKIMEEAGEGVILQKAELLMSEEDKLDEDFIEHLIEEAKLEGDTTMIEAFRTSENVHKVVVAIRILKPNI